jgi:DnaJ domain
MTRRYGTFFGLFADRDVTAYRTLGVSEYASDTEIEQAYLRLIAQYDPDRLAGLARPLRRQAEKKANAIGTAYDRIRTLRKRHEYRHSTSESSHSAKVTLEARGTTAALFWVAVIALAMVIGLVLLRDLLMPASPQARMPTPDASAKAPPVSPTVAAPPEPVVPAPVEAATGGKVPAEEMMVLMPTDSPPAQPAPLAPSGEAGLVEGLRAGQLRPANGSDLSRWTRRWSEVNGRGVPAVFQERSGSIASYVIQKDFTIPEGLNGAHAVIFLLDTSAPYPRGNPGHSVVLDLSTGACVGATCGMLLD